MTQEPSGPRENFSRQFTYDSLLGFIKEQAGNYMKNSSAIKPGDNLVSPQRFGADDISYFAVELERKLKLKIPLVDWQNTCTFDDLIKLLLKYLQKAEPDGTTNFGVPGT